VKFEEAVDVVKKAQQEGPSREDMEALYGEVWDTTELQRDFYVKSFFAPLVIVSQMDRRGRWISSIILVFITTLGPNRR
jgi:hypothetical protein